MIKQIFNKPKKFNKFVTRQVDPMELFWDLIFVVTLRYIIDAYIVDFNMFTFIVGLLVFLETYLFWTNINIYSVNYYDVSHNNRLWMTLMLSPLLIIASITSYTTQTSIYYLALSFVLLKLMQAYSWSQATKTHKRDKQYRVINSIYRNEVRVYILCAFIASLLFIVPQYVIPIMIVLIVTELFLPSLLNRNRKVEYNFDRLLIAERYLLFIILIFGEGFIGVIHIFQHLESISFDELMRGLLVFWTLYAMFLKVYDEYTIHKERISTTFMIFLATYVISSMLMITSLLIIGLETEYVDFAIRIVSLLGVTTYNLTYIYNSYRYLTRRREFLFEEDVKYYKRDLYQSIIALAVSVITITFVTSPLILLTILSAIIIYSTKHIAIRAKTVERIFAEDHKIIEIND